ncbi:cGMP-specific 3'5'-cyclic phosphodiesterase, partial [Dissostichus eleginoides]
VLSNHMDVLGLVLDNVQLYESSRQEAKRSQALIEMAQVLSKKHCSFDVLLSKMAATIMPFTHAQYCTIFIPGKQTLDENDQISFSNVIHLECEELGSTCQIYRRERDISDIDQSHALQTLVAMETLKMSQISEETITSLICCPVRNERSTNVIAVCQLMKKWSIDSDDMEAFNRYDERLLEDLALYCGLAMQYVKAVLITEERRASIEVTQEVLAYHITAAEQEIQALQEASIPSVESLHMLDFHFSEFGLPEERSTQATIRMFLDLNLTLCQWVLSVRRGYRNSVPYHNWSHALSTAQSMFAMLMATDQLKTIFSRLEILALMIATLNHDIDHRGLYGHSSLENHHYNLCIFILENTGSQILSSLSAEDHRAVLHMLKRAILATDLNVYMERRTEFFNLAKKSRVNWKSEKKKDLLRSMLMTASDLSAITKPWPEQKRIANLVTMEFFAQGDKEKQEFKIKPIDIMNRENSPRLPYMQVEYIDDICYPLYKAVSRLFDTCSPLLAGCKKNRANWMHLAMEAQDENYPQKKKPTERQEEENDRARKKKKQIQSGVFGTLCAAVRRQHGSSSAPAEPPALGTGNGELKKARADESKADSEQRDEMLELYKLQMPEDLYHFWNFCKELCPESPRGALKDTLGLQLVGPFDILAGAHKKSKSPQPNFHLHWRYLYDPPEFQTILLGSKDREHHIGYYRDTPDSLPAFVGENEAKKGCTITQMGDNVFAAVLLFLLKRRKERGSKKADGGALESLEAQLRDRAETLGLSLEQKTKGMKQRDKKVVTKTFHGAGIVVPVDKNDVGYRELPETDAGLKKILKAIVEARNDEERVKAFGPLQEMVTFVQFANDECDYGMGYELGLDLFCYGSHQNDSGPCRALRTLRPAQIHLALAKGPSSSSHPDTECQAALKEVSPGAAAPTGTRRWLLLATRPPRVDLHNRCTRTVYGRWVSVRSPRSALTGPVSR